MRAIRIALAALLASVLLACGGDSDSGGTAGGSTAPPVTYSVGVTLTGLPYASALTLQDNSGDDLTLSANGTAHFAKSLVAGSSYSVTVSAQARNQACKVTNGTGTIHANVAVTVDCPHFAYVTNRDENSVRIYSLNNTSGVLTELTSISPINNAAYGPYGIALSPNQSYVYVVSTGIGNTASAVTQGVFGFSCDASSGALTEINPGAAFLTGSNPWTVAFTPTGTEAYVTNFSGATVSEYAADSSAGGLTGPNTSPATGAFPFTVTVAPNGKWAFVANSYQGIGGNSISVYSIAADGSLTEITGSPFTVDQVVGDNEVTPAITIDPTSSFAFVAGNNTTNLYVFAIAADGSLHSVTGSPFATVGSGNPSWTAIHPSGKFAYVANYSNFGSSVSMFAVAANGTLTNIGSGSVSAGLGAETMTIDPTGNFAYVVNQQDNTISAYSIDQTGGGLTAIGSPVNTGLWPEMMVIR